PQALITKTVKPIQRPRETLGLDREPISERPQVPLTVRVKVAHRVPWAFMARSSHPFGARSLLSAPGTGTAWALRAAWSRPHLTAAFAIARRRERSRARSQAVLLANGPRTTFAHAGAEILAALPIRLAVPDRVDPVVPGERGSARARSPV